MKTLLLATLAAVLAAPSAFALNINDVAGKYSVRASSNLRPVPRSYNIRIESIGAVYLTLRTQNGALECRGSAMMSQNVLSSAQSCDDGRFFEHKIIFQNVNIRAPNFQVRVINGFDGSNRMMMFHRQAQ
jgi:hypothetical protein